LKAIGKNVRELIQINAQVADNKAEDELI